MKLICVHDDPMKTLEPALYSVSPLKLNKAYKLRYIVYILPSNKAGICEGTRIL